METKKTNTNAFTMIELVFVIVIIGILASIAIPRLAASRSDAIIAKAKSQIAAIRAGIANEKSKVLMEGGTFDSLEDGNDSESGTILFENVLDYPIKASGSKDGDWELKSNASSDKGVYTLHVEGEEVDFTFYKKADTTADPKIKKYTFACDMKDANTGDLCVTLSQ